MCARSRGAICQSPLGVADTDDDNGGEPTYWLASADWLPRNFDRRVEIAFPVLDRQYQVTRKHIFEVQLADSIKGWQMQSDGAYLRSPGGVNNNSRSQERLYELMQTECSAMPANG